MNQRGALTFSQRHGHEPVPEPLQLEELPAAARTAIWNALFACLQDTCAWDGQRYHVGRPWSEILLDLHVQRDNGARDLWNTDFQIRCLDLKDRLVARLQYHEVFSLIEFILQHPRCPPEFTSATCAVFRDRQLAYMVDVGPPASILPATTLEEGEQLRRNLQELRAARVDGCTAHFRQAAACLSAKDWAGSVRESIHAVESMAKQITPGAKTLGSALKSLEERGVLQHKALKEAFSKLYGYTSDEKGIRHALADESANVTIDEAVFMLGACASFASYLWRKHKAAGDTP